MMNRNKQNDTVNEHMAKAGMATRMLQALDLTVLSVTGIGECPRIRIIGGAACKQLKPGYIRRIKHEGHRITERVADVSGCIVTWEERA